MKTKTLNHVQREELLVKSFGVRIKEAGSEVMLDGILTEMEAKNNAGCIHSGDYDSLKNYANHRKIVLKHSQSLPAKLSKRIEQIDRPEDFHSFFGNLLQHQVNGRITESEYYDLKNLATNKICEMVGNLEISREEYYKNNLSEITNITSASDIVWARWML